MKTANLIVSERPRTAAHIHNHLDLIQEVVEMLPHPQDATEKERFEDVVDALLRCDGHEIAQILDQPVHRFGGAYFQVETYALAVIAINRLTQQGVQVIGGEDALQIIRHQVRHELISLPPNLGALWLIPVSLSDRTAAHVAALLLMRGAKIARPWIWPGIPDHGRFQLIACEADSAALLNHPYADHHRCEGPLVFTNLASSWAHAHC